MGWGSCPLQAQGGEGEGDDEMVESWGTSGANTTPDRKMDGYGGGKLVVLR